MKSLNWTTLLLVACFAVGCGVSPPERKESAYRIYVTNEASGDLTVIDSATHEVTATIPLGKRPRGIRASLDRKTIYVALSGSPFAPVSVKSMTEATCALGSVARSRSFRSAMSAVVRS